MIHELILSIVISWGFVKIIKTIIDWSKHKKLTLKLLLHDGGMPSGHTVGVVSLATGLFLETGISALSVIGVVFTLIVINDALKLRNETEQHAKVLNKLQKEVKLNERIGHKPIEVIVSTIIGIVIPIIIYAVL